jgi:formylglycine-generating enzyme required for sulfatase activity
MRRDDWFAPGHPLAEPLERLAIQLQASTAGCLIIAVANDEATRREAVAELGRRLFGHVALSEFHFLPDRLSLAQHLRRLLPPTGPSAVLADGLSQLPAADRAQAMQYLNVERETLREAGYSVVLWIEAATMSELTFKAPDFWVWCSAICEFRLDLSREIGFTPSPLARLELKEADRLRRLNALYEEQMTPPPANLSLAADLFLNLSKVGEQLGEPPERVQEWRQRAYQLLSEAGDVRELRRDYLAYLSESCRWLDFRGILQMRQVVRLPTAEVFVPLKVTPPAELRPERLLQEAERIREKVPIQELLPRYRRIVILGDPGAGKTTFLRYVALALAAGPAATQERLGVRATWLPILFPIAAYAEKLKEAPDLPLTDYLSQYFQARELPDLGPLFRAEIERGNCLFLLDGLDEVGSPGDRLAAVKRLADLARRYPDNCLIVTSRIAGYYQAPLADDFVHLTIQPFDDEDIARFAGQWCHAYETLDGVTPQAEERARQRAARLVAEIHSDPNVVKLAANPLLLSILALIHYQGTRLPHQRAELYRLCVEALAETWNRARGLSGRPINLFLGDRPLDERFVVDVLGSVAFWMHEHCPERVVERRDLEQRIAERLQEREQLSSPRARELAGDFIRLMEEKAGLLVARGLDLFGFLHLTFEEYLAARYLVDWLDYEQEAARRAADPRWDEVIRLGAACLRGRYVARLVQAVADARLQGDALRREVVLAGRCVTDVGAQVVGKPVAEGLIPRLVETMQGLEVPIRTRAEAGEVLDELGWLPDDRDAFLPIPDPAHPAFWLARYPVTNAQYERFIQAGGYEEPRWWSKEGLKWLKNPPGYRRDKVKQPEYWDNPRFNRKGYPVVGVSWYEAEAYCNWLTERLKDAGYRIQVVDRQGGTCEVPLAACRVRLPAEEEWLLAAGGEGKGKDEDRFPWDPPGQSTWQLPEKEREARIQARANVWESQIGGTTPVGMYPAGASLYGLWDMAGNVWEWTASWYDEKTKEFRVLRGGSWYDYRHLARCAYRGRYYPDNSDDGLGFRVVVSPGSP